MKSFIQWIESVIPVYRGESIYNKNGHYWTTDKKWALQFTQSGKESEIKSATIESDKIYRAEPLPHATAERELEQAIEDAKNIGFDAVWVDEGRGEPNSIFIINP